MLALSLTLMLLIVIMAMLILVSQMQPRHGAQVQIVVCRVLVGEVVCGGGRGVSRRVGVVDDRHGHDWFGREGELEGMLLVEGGRLLLLLVIVVWCGVLCLGRPATIVEEWHRATVSVESIWRRKEVPPLPRCSIVRRQVADRLIRRHDICAHAMSPPEAPGQQPPRPLHLDRQHRPTDLDRNGVADVEPEWFLECHECAEL
mmetsp:Transcript_4368/g.10014  ORF Transcript_4368/g.10014 Transcript_4368/m.10014 type:complete len:202 (+) Transcript_4368:203-808(+)